MVTWMWGHLRATTAHVGPPGQYMVDRRRQERCQTLSDPLIQIDSGQLTDVSRTDCQAKPKWSASKADTRQETATYCSRFWRP